MSESDEHLRLIKNGGNRLSRKKKYGLKLSTVRKLEDELCDYPNYDKRIRDIREQARYPYIRTDTNIGGEHKPSNSSKVEMVVTNYLSDIRLGNIKTYKTAIERVFNRSSEKEKDVIKTYYFGQKTMAYTCDETHISESTFHRIKKKVILRLAEELGEY
ncbi:transcriptional regulator [Staphylococcus warneri]|uniref:transcriptional regulator n=1 Tax=Staphylococcus warneri TaxID=1292 RepID=UPI000687C414|nr:transcriptional regulator [Staphylococcus warneri]MBF0770280.1 transcriptional regulator [Staphylococcus warneri]QNQ45145.1 transcriptional regulator [Staphylococcus warneri]TFU64820.1 transcriptional regulator [Staphylococcus warneri]